MKSAYIISNRELIEVLGAHLRTQGFNTSDMTIRFTSTNAVVAGIVKIEAEPESFEDEEPEADSDWGEDEDEMATLGAAVLVLDELNSPRTAKELASNVGVEVHEVHAALAELQSTGQAAKVAPAREDGETVSVYMRTGTEAYDAFVAAEEARVEAQVEKWAPTVLLAAPKFYQGAADRMEILERICEDLGEESAEEIRKDCRNVFYGMAARNLLFHQGHGWKAFRTEADEKNLDMLRRAVREVEDHEGMPLHELAEALPGEVDLDLLRYALRG